MNIKYLITNEEKQKGISEVNFIPYNQGFLYVYDSERSLSFSGKNNKVDSEAIFLSSCGEVLDIVRLNKGSDRYFSCNAMYMLQVSLGYFERKQLSIGSIIPVKNKKANSDVVNKVLNKLPVDIYEAVKNVPVEIIEAEEIRGQHTNGEITLYDNHSDPKYLEWTLAHEYWHAFVYLGKMSYSDGFGKELYDSILERINNSYYDERKKELARDFFKRHLTMGNITNPEYVLYDEMFADGLANLVTGGSMNEAINSYADNWVSNLIWEKLGSNE